MSEKYIILFDGICNFCNSSVNFIIERDIRNRFIFAPIQSESGKKLMNHFGLDAENLKTIILIEGERYYTKTTAALRIAKELKGIDEIAVLRQLRKKAVVVDGIEEFRKILKKASGSLEA